MVAAREGVVGGLGGVGPVGAGLVPVVGLIVPVAIVEILVVIGNLGACQPVDGHSLVRDCVYSARIVPGIGSPSTANHPET